MKITQKMFPLLFILTISIPYAAADPSTTFKKNTVSFSIPVNLPLDSTKIKSRYKKDKQYTKEVVKAVNNIKITKVTKKDISKMKKNDEPDYYIVDIKDIEKAIESRHSCTKSILLSAIAGIVVGALILHIMIWQKVIQYNQ